MEMSQVVLRLDLHESAEPGSELAIWSDQWVPYPNAVKILERLKFLYWKPPTIRPMNALIFGSTNNGKTMIVQKFRENIRKTATPTDKDRAFHPVVIVQTPADGDIGVLLWLILRELGAPRGVTTQIKLKRSQVMDLLPKAGTRMLIIDEVHNILNAKSAKQLTFLQELKFLSNDLLIPIVCVGTVEALRAMQTDQQIGNRFEPMELPVWQPNEDFRDLLVMMTAKMGIDDGGLFDDPQFLTSVHEQCEGLLGEGRKLIAEAATIGLKEGKTRLEPEFFNRVGWTRPSMRRKRGDG